jgi:hypothetical protein
MKRFWSYINGRKSIVGAILIAAPVALDQVRELAVALGLDPVKAATYAGTALLVLGLLHKLWKAITALDAVTTTVTVTTAREGTPAPPPPEQPSISLSIDGAAASDVTVTHAGDTPSTSTF